MPEANAERALTDLVFVAFNSRVAALDRFTGDIVWDWKSPQGAGYVSLFLDGDRLIAAVNGYIYCLDPMFGQEVWRNPMKGFGLGITSVCSTHGSTNAGGSAEAARQAAAAAAASSNPSAATM